ncbi:MAG: acyl carrier protein [Methylococcales bacterium]|nr:acyl carrier protein [Methylococcales bacterium]
MAVDVTFEEVASQLCDFLRANVLAGDVAVDADTELSHIGIDSFSLMELVLFIERRFGLELPAESLTPENIASVRCLSTYCVVLLNKHRNA